MIVAFADFIETTGFFSGEAKSIGLQRCATHVGEPWTTFFGKVKDPEARKIKLAAELANRRLAITAIIGRFVRTDSRGLLGATGLRTMHLH